LSAIRYQAVGEEFDGQRLDNFLLRELKGAPKSLIYRLIRTGEVRVNKGRSKPDRKLKPGDVVRIPPVRIEERDADPAPGLSLQRLLDQSIVYESAKLIVLNKPAGLAVHGGSGIHLGVIEALRQLRQEEGLELVHRLDRDTSGCLMIARKRSMLRYLQSLLREERKIDKQYLTLVMGKWPVQLTCVDQPLLRGELPNGERFVRVRAEGKSSRTEYRVLESFADATLLKAKPLTGRTHQIRVHALHSGHAVAGDEKYGSKDDLQEFKRRGLTRLFLHAWRLRIPMEDDSVLEVESPLPSELENFLKKLRSNE